jgi:SRSO17 transposase
LLACYLFKMDTRGIESYTIRFGEWFIRGVHNKLSTSSAYLKGLFSWGKSNMERMAEQLSVNEQQLHHFISVSDWDAKGVMGQVATEAEKTFSSREQPKGLLLDESGWLKKGKKSVGVAKQYLGSVGKIENGQVVVFAALAQGAQVALVDAELYLPREWTQDAQRMKQAGVPQERWEYKTKAALALQIVDQLDEKVTYDWIGGDSIYGNSSQLRQALHRKGKCFVLDTNLSQEVYLSDPAPYVPARKPGAYRGNGRKKSSYASDQQPTTVKALAESLEEAAWETVAYRKGTKGWLSRRVTVVEVYLWKAKRPNDENVEHYRLLLSKRPDGSELKYSLVNDVKQPLDVKTLLYYQMQRYWIERAFQETKQQLGLTQYQVRSWKALYHHLALCMMAFHYIVEQQLLYQQNIPLLSASDVKLLIAQDLIKAMDKDRLLDLIAQRHLKRQMDINRYYRE